MLGGLTLYRDRDRIPLGRVVNAARLLAYLAYHLGRELPREHLREILWPDDEFDDKHDDGPPDRRGNLRRALHDLRRLLTPAGQECTTVLRTDGDRVYLDPEAVSTDVAEFRNAWRLATRHPSILRGGAPQGEEPKELPSFADGPGCGAVAPQSEPSDTSQVRVLTEAIELYQGRFLLGYSDRWIEAAAEELEVIYRKALRQLLTSLRESNPQQAFVYAQKALETSYRDEEDYLAAMRLALDLGRADRTLSLHRELARWLARIPGRNPGDEAQQLLAEARRREDVRVSEDGYRPHPVTGIKGYSAPK